MAALHADLIIVGCHPHRMVYGALLDLTEDRGPRLSVDQHLPVPSNGGKQVIIRCPCGVLTELILTIV
jgi:hypothetical protein